MSIFPLLPNSGRCRFPELFALAQILFLGVGCATVAGFEDFKANGTGGFGNSGAATNGGTGYIVSTGGGNNVATGGVAGFPGTGGAVAATGGRLSTGGGTGCGQVQQACCSGSTCGAGLECYQNSCRSCGFDHQSCCNNGATSACVTGAGCCVANAVCVSTSSALQSVCSISCGASGQTCCTGAITGGTYTGTGCAEGTALTCKTSTGTCN